MDNSKVGYSSNYAKDINDINLEKDNFRIRLHNIRTMIEDCHKVMDELSGVENKETINATLPLKVPNVNRLSEMDNLLHELQEEAYQLNERMHRLLSII